MNEKTSVLSIRDLRIRFRLINGVVPALGGIDIDVMPGESIGIGGESGCGKSVTVQSCMGLLPQEGEMYSGSITYHYADGRQVDIAQLSPKSKELLQLRRQEMSMVFQEPSASLSPLHTVYRQMEEAIKNREKLSKAERREICADILGKVGIRQPERWLNEYPFRLSGGMAQRVMIAQAIVKEPRIIFADEPTTALDVTVQAQVLKLMDDLRRDMGIATVFITHNMGILAHMTERIYIMYLGRIVESGLTRDIFHSPKHPYTQGLIACTPTLSMPKHARLYNIKGVVSSKDLRDDACSFYPRCEKAIAGLCDCKLPRRRQLDDDHWVACHLYDKEA